MPFPFYSSFFHLQRLGAAIKRSLQRLVGKRSEEDVKYVATCMFIQHEVLRRAGYVHADLKPGTTSWARWGRSTWSTFGFVQSMGDCIVPQVDVPRERTESDPRLEAEWMCPSHHSPRC